MRTIKISHMTVLIITVVILFFVSALFVRNYERLHTRGVFKPHRPHATLQNPDAVQSWMTFDYINHTFKIPDAYFKEVFTITSTEYPKITIKKVAKIQGKASATFLIEVKENITKYMTLIVPKDAQP